MAGASGHYEQMEDLVASEIFVLIVENRKFECIDDTAYSIDDTAGKEPSECRGGQGVEQLGKCQDAGPTHSNVKYG